MEENTNQTPQGFDPSSVSKNSWIVAAIAAVGAIGVFLPWIKVTFWGISVSAAGTKDTWGIIALVAFIIVIVFTLFGNAFKMDPKQKETILKSATTLPAIACIIFLIANNEGISYFSFGYYLSLAAGVISALIGYKVIKLG